ncbi:MAG: imidazolonepropionase, partial [Rhodobacteraceae bacterium]|nr:imidazolonepropionase [Paracoccaceae bacterium]
MINRILIGARIATMPATGGFGLIDSGAIALKDGLIDWIGTDLPAKYAGWPIEDMQGRLITPALIDCHTHLVFGGNRAQEFEMRLNGAGYEE